MRWDNMISRAVLIQFTGVTDRVSRPARFATAPIAVMNERSDTSIDQLSLKTASDTPANADRRHFDNVEKIMIKF